MCNIKVNGISMFKAPEGNTLKQRLEFQEDWDNTKNIKEAIKVFEKHNIKSAIAGSTVKEILTALESIAESQEEIDKENDKEIARLKKHYGIK